MAKFNKKSVGTKTVNRAGGEAFSQSPELELVSLLLTSFVSDKFYESAGEQLKRLQDVVVAMKDKKFPAQAAIYARTKFGMRSITHALAGELFRKDGTKNPVAGLDWVKRFIDKVVFRPDDALEILSYYGNNVMEKSIPSQLKKGLALSLNKFGEYQLAKYRGGNKEVKLVDILNLVHPKPSEKQKELFKKLINGELKSTQTWEAKQTKAGQEAAKIEDEGEREEKLAELKAANWKELVESRKIGYFALLRNLRNILEQAPDIVDKAAEMLTDGDLIKKSLVLPFRFITASDELAKVGGAGKFMKAITVATDKAISNCPEFPGRTLIVMDTSGSMDGQPLKIGSLFMAAIAKRNPGADTISFSDNAKYFTMNPASLVTDMIKSIPNYGSGTNFHAIFSTMNKPYDRIIILSDMQGWVGYDAPTSSFSAYKKKYSCSPHVYSFDLAGHGDLQFPENNVCCIAGFSEKVLDLMKLLEQDRDAMINEIKKIVI